MNIRHDTCYSAICTRHGMHVAHILVAATITTKMCTHVRARPVKHVTCVHLLGGYLALIKRLSMGMLWSSILCDTTSHGMPCREVLYHLKTARHFSALGAFLHAPPCGKITPNILLLEFLLIPSLFTPILVGSSTNFTLPKAFVMMSAN